mgnify:CR=1 FL=1
MYALKTFILYLLLTTLSATCLRAQGQTQINRFGNVSGIVSESIDGETLIGVNLLIKGTSLGTSTDEYGEYLIRRIPEGEQILIVSYIGYESIERTINVISGKNTVINFTLKPQTLEGQEIVVSSQASGQKSAINEQINSRTIKNVVSAEKIHEFCSKYNFFNLEPANTHEIELMNRLYKCKVFVTSWGTAWFKNGVYLSDNCTDVYVLVIGPDFHTQYQNGNRQPTIRKAKIHYILLDNNSLTMPENFMK